jgi:hypothetical protein
MNRKLVVGAVAGVAAVALAYGGTTYSAWSDFGEIQGNTVATGHLKLNLQAKDGGQAVPINFGSFAPGHGWATSVWIASNDGQSVPNGALSMKIQNLNDYENGCGSTNSEKAVDPTCVNSSNGDSQLGGELSANLGTDMYWWAPGTPGQCTDFPGTQTAHSIIHSSMLQTKVGQTFDITTLTPGQGVCVRLEQYLPSSAGDDVQSDSVAYDLHFDLAQA